MAGAVARKTTLRPQATGEPPNRRPWHSPCPASADPSSGRNGRIAPTTATQCARPSARGPSDKRRTSACGGTACGDATVGRQLAARACGGNASPSLLLLKYPRTCEHGQAGRWGAADCWGKRKRGRVRRHCATSPVGPCQGPPRTTAPRCLPAAPTTLGRRHPRAPRSGHNGHATLEAATPRGGAPEAAPQYQPVPACAHRACAGRIWTGAPRIARHSSRCRWPPPSHRQIGSYLRPCPPPTRRA